MYELWLDANTVIRWTNLIIGILLFWSFVWLAVYTVLKKQVLVSFGFRILAMVEFLVCYMSAAALAITNPRPTGTGFVAFFMNIGVIRLMFYLQKLRKTEKKGTLLEL